MVDIEPDHQTLVHNKLLNLFVASVLPTYGFIDVLKFAIVLGSVDLCKTRNTVSYI